MVYVSRCHVTGDSAPVCGQEAGVTRSKEGLCWVQRSLGGGTPGAGAGPATRTRGELALALQW